MNYSDTALSYDEASLRRHYTAVLARHAPELTEAIQTLSHTEIFDALRRYPRKKQRHIMGHFYEVFPNGVDVGNRIYRINNVPWGSARSVGKKKDAVRRSWSKHIDLLGRFYANPLNNISIAWSSAWIAVSDDTLYARRDALSVVDDIAESAASPAMQIDPAGGQKAVFFAGRDVEFEVVKDLLPSMYGNENPWTPLFDIFELGLLIRGFDDGTLRLFSRRGVEELKI
jgi:hypothetical protein